MQHPCDVCYRQFGGEDPAHGYPNETTRIPHAAWRHGFNVAACGECAAIENAGDRFFDTASPDRYEPQVRAFRLALKEAGYVEGRNIAIEYRWGEGRVERLPALAEDLVKRQVAVIAAMGGDTTALAAKAATASIPIVFENGSDRIKSGLVTSLNCPGGNVTGVSLFAGTLDAKRLALIHELVPGATVIAVLSNPLVAEAAN